MKKYLKDYVPLMKEYNYKKNSNINLEKMTLGTHNKVWWICENGHEWEADICSRFRTKCGCPYCSGRKAIAGKNDFLTLHPELKSELSPNNINIKLDELPEHSEKKILWICKKCGYEYSTMICLRTKGTGCPVCSGKIIIKGKNDIFTKFPKLKKYWDYEKNIIDPYKIGRYSHTKVKLFCEECGKEFEISLSKVKDDILCPKCSIKRGALKRKNILKIANKKNISEYYPELLKMWDYEKNKEFNPDDLYISGSEKVWWICENGHSFRATIPSMIEGKQCPVCISETRMSFPEKAVVYYLKKNNIDVLENYILKGLNGKEIDIYISNLKIGIEYDGNSWHQDKNRDLAKNNLCKENGIKLIRIREEGCPKLNSSSIDFYIKPDLNYNSLNLVIYNILKDYFNIIDNNINAYNDRINIYELLYRSRKKDSLLNKYPELAKEWDYEKNGKIKPENVYSKSGRKFYWKCINGHSYEATISHRVVDNTKCPYCSNQKILKGYNDLTTIHSEILKEWDYEKNNLLKIYPEKMTYGTHKKAWFKCINGHSYMCSISNKSKGRKCPYCSNQKILKGYNDVATTNPLILKEWDYEKNTITPYEVSRGSDKKVWFKCHNCGNSWQSRINHRVVYGIGCPNCHKKYDE